MTHLDDNVMVNNVPINKNATKQTSKPLAESKNLLLNLEIRNKVMEAGLASLASSINILLVPITSNSFISLRLLMHARQHYLILLVRLNGLPPKFHLPRQQRKHLNLSKILLINYINN